VATAPMAATIPVSVMDLVLDLGFNSSAPLVVQ